MKYVHGTYRDAKRAMIKLWTSLGEVYPVCAVCGCEAHRCEAHHLFLSSRYLVAHNDIRNLVPVCGQGDNPDCHTQEAHGGQKGEMANRLYLRLGRNDPFAGRHIVMKAVTEWGLKTDVWVPEVMEEYAKEYA